MLSFCLDRRECWAIGSGMGCLFRTATERGIGPAAASKTIADEANTA